MEKSQIGTVEAVMLILTIVVAHTILSLPQAILSSQKSASLLNIIYISILAIFIAFLIYKLFKKFPGLDIIDISELVGGKVFRNIVGIIFISHFVISSSILLRSFCETLKIVYYPMTNIVFLLALFVIVICAANRLDFSATLKTNLLILPVALASICFLFFSNINQFTPQRIFPILGEGAFQTFVVGLTNLGSFGGIAYLYFLPPLLQEPKKFKKVTLISVGVTALYLLLSIATLLFMFSFFTNTNQISPLYSAARYIEFGNFFQRLESLFLLIWIIVFACYMSIAIKFAMNILKKILNLETKKPLINIFGLLIFGIALLPKNYAITQNFQTKIYPYIILGIVFFLGIGILLIANLSRRKIKSTNN